MKEFEKIFLKDLNSHINHKTVEDAILKINPDAENKLAWFWQGLNTRKITLYGALLSLRPLKGSQYHNYNRYSVTKWFVMFTEYLEMCGFRWKK